MFWCSSAGRTRVMRKLRKARLNRASEKVELMTVHTRPVDGEELGEVAENVLTQLAGAVDFGLHDGVEQVGCAACEQKREERVSGLGVALSARMPDQVDEAFRWEIMLSAAVADFGTNCTRS